MFTIKKSDFDKLRREHPDYIVKATRRHECNGLVCEAGDYMGFDSIIKEGLLRKGTRLIFEHIHFEVV